MKPRPKNVHIYTDKHAYVHRDHSQLKGRKGATPNLQISRQGLLDMEC